MNLNDTLILIGSVFGIFATIIILIRIFGLRTFAKMSGFDFASTIAIGSILASIVMNKNQSLLKGALALFVIILFQTIFSFLVRKFNWFDNLFTNKPQMLMRNGEIFYETLKKCNVSEADLMAKLREANVHQLTEVQAVIFESTGDISVLHSSNEIEIDSIILKDVAN